MEQLNKVELKGIVGNIRLQDFEDCAMARFSVATNFAYKSPDGNYVVDTTWHNCLAWSTSVPKNTLKLIQKGSKVHLFGRIRYQKYMGVDGIDRTSTDIMVSKLAILDDETTTYQTI